MTDIVKSLFGNVPTRFADMSDGTFAAAVFVAGNDGLPELVDGLLPVDGSGVTQPTKDQNGLGAVRYTTDTTAVTGVNYAQVMCLTETVFASFTRTDSTGSIVGITLGGGTLLIGPVTAYTLTSGAVAAYE